MLIDGDRYSLPSENAAAVLFGALIDAVNLLDERTQVMGERLAVIDDALESLKSPESP